MKKFFLCFVAILQLACASLVENGEKALAEGKYEEALSYFEQALSANSNNAEAREGLRQARQSWIERKLIDVRHLRLGGNISESESLLLDLLKKENDWKIFPNGAAYSTQKEEVAEVGERVDNRINVYLALKNPLAAQVVVEKYGELLERTMQKNMNGYHAKLYSSGKEFCETQKRKLKKSSYYSARWLEQTCKIWNISTKLPSFQNSVTLFKDMKVNTQISGLPSGTSGVIAEQLQKAFASSKWRSKDSKTTWELSVKGKFESSQSESPVIRAANYPVQVPYEEVSTRAKKVEKDPGLGLALLSLLIGGGPNERTIDNRDGTETVYTTKYRTEMRIHTYKAINVIANKNLVGEMSSHLSGKKFALKFDESYKLHDDRHNENFPEAGLRPSAPKILPDEQWVKEVGPTLFDDVAGELEKAWVVRFCDGPQVDNKSLGESETNHRCAYQVTSKIPENLRQYYLKNFDIEFTDWQNLISRKSGGDGGI